MGKCLAVGVIGHIRGGNDRIMICVYPLAMAVGNAAYRIDCQDLSLLPRGMLGGWL